MRKYLGILTIFAIVSLFGMVYASQVNSSSYSIIFKPKPVEINSKQTTVTASVIDPKYSLLRISFSNLTDVIFEMKVSRDGEMRNVSTHHTNEQGYVDIIDAPGFVEGGLYDLEITILSSKETGDTVLDKLIFNTQTSISQEYTFMINLETRS